MMLTVTVVQVVGYLRLIESSMTFSNDRDGEYIKTILRITTIYSDILFVRPNCKYLTRSHNPCGFLASEFPSNFCTAM